MFHSDDEIGTKQLKIISYQGLFKLIEKKRAAENDLKELPNLKIGSKAFNNWLMSFL